MVAGAGELIGHTDRVAAFAFCRHPAHGGLCASGSDDGSVQVWDADSLGPLGEHDLHQVGARSRRSPPFYISGGGGRVSR